MKLIGLKTCSTCKLIEKMLKQANLDYCYQDVRENPPMVEQIRGWLSIIQEDNIKKLVNTSGNVYKSLGLKDKWEQMNLDEKVNLLASDGMLIKRPILELDNGRIFIGKDIQRYLEEGEKECVSYL